MPTYEISRRMDVGIGLGLIDHSVKWDLKLLAFRFQGDLCSSQKCLRMTGVGLSRQSVLHFCVVVSRDPNCQGWRERARGLRKLVDRISPMEQTRRRTNQIWPESCWATAASVSSRIRYDPHNLGPGQGRRKNPKGNNFCMTSESKLM